MKIPPHNIETEQNLLAGMVINQKIIPLVQEKISESDFYKSSHGLMFQAICDMKKDIDFSTLTQWFNDHNHKIDLDYISEVIFSHSTSVDWKVHAEKIKNLSQRRQLIVKCQETSEAAELDLDDALNVIGSGIKSIMSEQQSELTYDEVLMMVHKDLEDKINSKDKTRGVLTGFDVIDSQIHGLAKKETYYIGAKRHTGKSALAVNVAENILGRINSETKEYYYKGIIPYFSVESNIKALTRRRIARESNIPLTRIDTGNIHPHELPNIFSADGAFEQLRKRNLHFYDQSKYRFLENIISRCEVLSLENNLLLVVVDYLQLINMKQTFRSKHDRYGEISDRMNAMAKDLNCPVMVLSQLNEDNQLKESRDIEDSASNIWLLKREDENLQTIDIICTKGKETGTWSGQLIFETDFMRYRDDE